LVGGTAHFVCDGHRGLRAATQGLVPARATSSLLHRSATGASGHRSVERDEKAKDEKAKDEKAKDEKAKDEKAKDEKAKGPEGKRSSMSAMVPRPSRAGHHGLGRV
jgi:hypothetical protein